MLSRHLFALVALSASLAACGGTSPEATCTKLATLRAKAAWPTSGDIEKACVSELTKVKEAESGVYKRIAVIIGKQESLEDAYSMMVGSIMRYGNDGEAFPQEKEAEFRARWGFGVAADASGAWATGDGKKLSDEECNEGAFVIARKKSALAIQVDVDKHTKELAQSCKTAKDDEDYVKKYKCMRRVAVDMNKFMRCSEYGVEE